MEVNLPPGVHMGPSGWVCPKCNSVYSPTWPECYKCNNNNSVTTNEIKLNLRCSICGSFLDNFNNCPHCAKNGYWTSNTTDASKAADLNIKCEGKGISGAAVKLTGFEHGGDGPTLCGGDDE